ncbi:kinase A anchor protein [Armillaria borealis]|uniref:Kinase A anchor protein n=1 Tax=Armillaria borealis TaxID=47425 RepID=A0AA39JU68_9AGAR|nr:kinase A anchor protein [Armillaria borealis]
MARPTHFLSIPLGQTHPTLRARVADVHAALNLATPDSTLLAGPQRVHLTLGVMNLTPESLPTALDLLHRLPTLLQLTAAPPTVTLDTLDVLKRESRRRAHVLWVGPSQPEPLFSQINQIFRDEGFITDTRPLKLHMTLMNSTYRRPRTKRPQPFDYDAILRQTGVLGCFGMQKSEYAELPMAVSMGSYDAPRVHLCKMGSWDTDGAYVSCGSAPLSKESV